MLARKAYISVRQKQRPMIGVVDAFYKVSRKKLTHVKNGGKLYCQGHSKFIAADMMLTADSFRKRVQPFKWLRLTAQIYKIMTFIHSFVHLLTARPWRGSVGVVEATPAGLPSSPLEEFLLF